MATAALHLIAFAIWVATVLALLPALPATARAVGRRILVSLAVAVCVMGLGASLATAIAARRGYQVLNVASGSMAPRIGVGDLVVTKEVAPSAIRVGDVITFRAPIGNQSVYTHRVVAVANGSNGPVFTTKGDANPEPDPWQVHYSGAGWRKQLVVPNGGTILDATHRPEGRLVVWGTLFGLVLTLLWPVIVETPALAGAEAV